MAGSNEFLVCRSRYEFKNVAAFLNMVHAQIQPGLELRDTAIRIKKQETSKIQSTYQDLGRLSLASVYFVPKAQVPCRHRGHSIHQAGQAFRWLSFFCRLATVIPMSKWYNLPSNPSRQQALEIVSARCFKLITICIVFIGLSFF